MTKIYSLCLTTENLNNRENKILYRIADLHGEQLERHISYDDLSHDNIGLNFNKHPRTHRDNYELNNLRIWEWYPTSSKYAIKSSIPFYELINQYNVATLGSDGIINALKSGINIPSYNNKRSLLVIGEDEDDYKVIEIDSNNVMSRGGIAKLKSNFNGCINGFFLNKEDFLSTENVIVYSSKGERLPYRLIYKYLKLPYSNFKLDTLDIGGKLELFINKEIKLNESFTRVQKKEIKNVFNEILQDYEIIEGFFEELGFNEENLKDKIDNISLIINNVLDDDNKWDRFSEGIIENIPSLNKKFTKFASDKFNEDNKEKIKTINLTITNRKQNIEELSKKSRQYENSIAKLIKDKENIENNILNRNKILDNLDLALKTKIEAIKGDMATFVSDISLMEVLNIGSAHDLNSDFYTNNANPKQKDVDIISDINEFSSMLSINLEIAGVNKENISAMSKYITGSLMQRKSLYLVGTNSNYIVNSISATYCGMNADIISVINPSIDIDSILRQINKCTSCVIVIENIINLNENIALLLPKIVKEKILIFSSDITETLNFIPDSILNSLNIICLDYLCNKPLEEQFSYLDSSTVDFRKKYDKRTYKVAMEELEKSLSKLVYSSLHLSSIAELISIIDEIGEKEGLYSWLLCKMIPILLIKKDENSIEELLNLVQLSDKKTLYLRKIVGLE